MFTGEILEHHSSKVQGNNLKTIKKNFWKENNKLGTKGKEF